jgi:hypothetical protein
LNHLSLKFIFVFNEIVLVSIIALSVRILLAGGPMHPSSLYDGSTFNFFLFSKVFCCKVVFLNFLFFIARALRIASCFSIKVLLV